MLAALLLVVLLVGKGNTYCNPTETANNCRLQLASPVTLASLCPVYALNLVCLTTGLAGCDLETKTLYSGPRQRTYDACCGSTPACLVISGPQSGAFCRTTPCFAGGTCFDHDDKKTGFCQCPMYFNGPFCELDQRPRGCALAGYPCRNAGSCVPTSDSEYFCRCPSTHVGLNCEFEAKPPSQVVCFPQDALVQLEDGSSLPMGKLQVGQRVLAMSSSGAVVPSKVLTFLDRKSGLFHFLRLHTDAGHLDVSAKHLVALSDGPNRRFVLAEQVSPGDGLISGNGSLLIVTKVTHRLAEGAFAPLTEEGTVLVQHFLCSCYAVLSSHSLADMVMTPVKLWTRLFGDAHTEGIHPYAQALASVAFPFLSFI